MEAELDELKELADRLLWRPMETAPKDGSRILAYGDIGLQGTAVVGIVKWIDIWSQWDANDDPEEGPWPCKLICWMPLPEPPAQIAE